MGCKRSCGPRPTCVLALPRTFIGSRRSQDFVGSRAPPLSKPCPQGAFLSQTRPSESTRPRLPLNSSTRLGPFFCLFSSQVQAFPSFPQLKAAEDRGHPIPLFGVGFPTAILSWRLCLGGSTRYIPSTVFPRAHGEAQDTEPSPFPPLHSLWQYS